MVLVMSLVVLCDKWMQGARARTHDGADSIFIGVWGRAPATRNETKLVPQKYFSKK